MILPVVSFMRDAHGRWETDFYTPPVLRGATLLPFSAPAVYKIRVLRAQDFYTPLALKTAKGQHLPALEVYKNQSPKRVSENALLHSDTIKARKKKVNAALAMPACYMLQRGFSQGESSTRSLKAPLKAPPKAPPNTPLKAPLKAPLKVPCKAPLKVSLEALFKVRPPHCAPEGAPLVTLPLALPTQWGLWSA